MFGCMIVKDTMREPVGEILQKSDHARGLFNGQPGNPMVLSPETKTRVLLVLPGLLCLWSFVHFFRNCFILVRVTMDPQLRIELQTLELCGRIITLHVLLCLLPASNLQSMNCDSLKAEFHF